MVLLRQEIGEVLREVRQSQGLTLRQVANRANVALGYLSEVERGQKEVSSEILLAVSDGLNTPLSKILSEVSSRIAQTEELYIPDTVPAEFLVPADFLDESDLVSSNR